MPKKVEISHKTIIFTAIFSVSIWLLFQIRQVLLMFFIAMVLMSALNPSVKKLESIRFPRWLAILTIYLMVIGILGIGLFGIVPPLIDQTSTLISQFPGFFKQFSIFGIDEKAVGTQLGQLSALPANIIKFVINVFSNMLGILALAVMTFYLLLERKNLDHYLTVLFGEEKEKDIDRVIDRIEERLGGWIRAQLLLMLISGVTSYIGFRIVGINFALPLAILAFLFEIIPSFGTTVAALPAIIIALSISPLHALAVAGWIFLIQQLMHTVFVPRVMKSVAGVNPLISIIALAIGLQLAGIGGALLAIPAFIVIEVVTGEYFASKGLRQTNT